MLIKNNSTSSKTGVEVSQTGAAITVLPGQIVSVDDDKGRALMNQSGDFIQQFYADDLRVTRRTLTTAEILASNTTPIQLVAAPWAGYAIVVQEVISSLDYNSAAYATNTDMEIRYDGSAVADGTGAEALMDSLDAILLLTADAVYRTPGLGAGLDTALTINKGITAITKTGDPATGNSPLALTVIYRVIAV